MELAAALRLVSNLHRGRGRWSKHRVAQGLIPQAPRAVVRSVDRVMSDDLRKLRQRVLRVPLCSMWSFQDVLKIDGLRYALRHLDAMVRDEPVTVFRFRGKAVIWNGNHRATAAIIRGRRSIRCRVYEFPARRRR